MMRLQRLLLPALLILAACSGRSSAGAGDTGSAGVSAGGAAAGEGGVGEEPGSAGAPVAVDGGSRNVPVGGEASGPIAVGGFQSVDQPQSISVGPGCSVYSSTREADTFASPAQVWSRISRYLFDEEREPLAALPSETTREWASDIATQAFTEAQKVPGGAPGLRRFLGNWLQLQASVIFEQDWATLLDGPADATQVLLRTPLLDPRRVGILTEVPFLVAHPSITQRGQVMSRAFGFPVPPPPHPADLTVVAEPGQTRRAALQQAIASAGCAGCHYTLDPWGFSLEHFDELGHYRDFDAGQVVDSSGTLFNVPGEFGEPVSFGTIDDFTYAVAPLCTTALALVSSHYQDALLANGIPVTAEDGSDAYADDQGYVALKFLLAGKTYRSLVKAMAQSRAFLE